MEMTELQTLVTSVVRDGGLGYDQKVRRLAALATDALPYPGLSEACTEALEKRIICDLYEGHAPFTPRYVLPDYQQALRVGLGHLELEPPADLDEAIAFLQIMYAHVPSVTTYPVYLGDLDVLLEPFVDDSLSDADLDRTLRRFWIGIDRMQPDAFVHLDLGPHDSRITRSILRVERSLRQAVPNITLKVDPAITPDDLLLDAVQTVFQTGKPHFVNHPMMVADHGERYASVSCYNSLKIGGGAHTLVRLDLSAVAHQHQGDLSFFDHTLRHYVELTCELAEARVRSLVEQQRFFDTHWLATEGLVDIERFTAMFGIFGLAECVNHLMECAGEPDARYGHDADADGLAMRIVELIDEMVSEHPMPYCGGWHDRCALHSQGGIDTDHGVTAGTRIPVGDEPDLLEHLRTCAPHHHHFPAGISDIFHVDETAVRNPEAMVDVITGAFRSGMRDFTFNLADNEFVRITGYLVRKSDLAHIAEGDAVRHGSDHFAAGAEEAFHLTERAVKRIGCHERAPR